MLKLIEVEAPFVLIGSPPCTVFSTTQNLNRERMDEVEWQTRMVEARLHVRFCVTLYRTQNKKGGDFIHGHPTGASSWRVKEMHELIQEEGVYVVTTHMCKQGMWQWYQGKKAWVYSPTTFIANSPHVARVLPGKCEGGHEHVRLTGQRTAEAAIYPQKLWDFVRA